MRENSLIREGKFIEAQQWVKEYYTEKDWHKIVELSADFKQRRNTERTATGWENFRNVPQGYSNISAYPTEDTYQASLRIFDISLNLNAAISNNDEITITPYWWDLTSDVTSLEPRLVTKEFLYRVLDTIPIDPRPLWRIRLERKLRRYRGKLFRLLHTQSYIDYVQGQWSRFRRFKLSHWDIYSATCFNDAVMSYFSEHEQLLMHLEGRQPFETQDTEYTDNKSYKTEHVRFSYLGFTIDADLYSPVRRGVGIHGLPWPGYSSLRTRFMITGPGGKYRLWKLSRRELRRLLRYAEIGYKPDQEFGRE